MSFILALDQGTTSSRAILFDQQGNVHGVAQQEFQQHYPQPGWVEHDALEIWHTQSEVMARVIKLAGLRAEDIAAVGITNQRETVVVWERSTGHPIHPAIVWQDRRTSQRCEQLRSEGYTEMIRNRTGLIPDPYFSGTKIEWILDHVPGARPRAAAGELAFGTIDSWLLWNLTQGEVHATDVSNASRTMLFDIHRCDWDDELLELLNIPPAMLPRVGASSEVFGYTAPNLNPAQIPISGIAGDQQAALFGQLCTQEGMAKCTFGTGCFLLMNTGGRAVESENNLLTTIAWQIDGQVDYALEGSVFMGGAVVQWLRDGLGIIQDASEVESLAASVPDNGGVYLVPAFAGLGAPHWDPYARGLIGGLTRGTTRAHIARAALEGIAYQVADLLEVMQSDCGIQLTELRVDGGASTNQLLIQFLSDLMVVPVDRPQVRETTAQGVAFLAGLAVEFWNSRNEIAVQRRSDMKFLPGQAPEQIRRIKAGWRLALDRSRKWVPAS